MGAEALWPVAVVAGVLAAVYLLFKTLKQGGKDAQARTAAERASTAERKAGSKHSKALDEKAAMESARKRSGLKKKRGNAAATHRARKPSRSRS